MKLKENFVLRQVAGSNAAASVDFNGMLTLNESGALLWRALEQGADRPALLAALTAEYDVSDAQAEQDIDEFLSTLQKAGCLEA